MDHRSFNPISFNKEVQIDTGFTDLVRQINDADIKLPYDPVIVSGSTILDKVTDSSFSLEIMEDITDDLMITLNPEKGCNLAHDDSTLISAYDESIAYYSTLEGKLAYVSHALVFMYRGAYYPLNRLSLLFCTASQLIHSKIEGSLLAKQWDVDTTINVEIAKQKGRFIVDNSFKNSILLIDGPLLAGDGLAYFYGSVHDLAEQNIIPVFIVKNSYSDMLIRSIPGLSGQYNSDLHYVNDVLREGTRTRFFKYTNNESKDKTKVFCYLKHKDNHSPIRVEFPTEVFKKNRHAIESIMDMIYYLIKVQGNNVNPQVRPIAIAEMFARETIQLINFRKDAIQMKLTPTMNEERGMF